MYCNIFTDILTKCDKYGNIVNRVSFIFGGYEKMIERAFRTVQSIALYHSKNKKEKEK